MGVRAGSVTPCRGRVVTMRRHVWGRLGLERKAVGDSE